MDYTNYVYMTFLYQYLAQPCTISLTRSLDSIGPASLTEVDSYCQFLFDSYGGDEPDYGPFIIAEGLASMLPASLGSVTGFRVIGFREGALNPVVRSSSVVYPGTLSGGLSGALPSFMAVTISAGTFTYRRKGPRFGWPACNDAFIDGNTPTGAFNNSFAGNTSTATPGLLAVLNDNSYWNPPASPYTTFPTVVRRVPNLKPDGTVKGDRLPTFITDPVSAVGAGDFAAALVATTRRTRGPNS